ncbi:MAG TPA: toll/interleukin-1 receptor domain-containing protein [Qipengyuania sp.]|nr:toll/interleukin-1 receptor domain-containing protein [Qipengyuania sp.]
MTERYSAFISYAHSDVRVARWLHRTIENYRFPRALIAAESKFGPVPKRLPPVFRDRDELAASGDLGAELREALLSSRFQIVICTPKAAQSKWVNEEIKIFKRQHGEHRTLALIAHGEPYGVEQEECFPPALRFRLGPDGELSSSPAEPIAADIRPGKDGRRLASLKLLAGISGVRLDALARRDSARRQRRWMYASAASTAVAVLTIGLAIYAESQRRIAVAQRDLAESSLSFLIDTFEIANPATENPRTITALTILDRASQRASGEFGTRPQVAARLLRATGTIYYNLGLQKESERDLSGALRFEPEEGESRALTLLRLAALAKNRGDVEELDRLIGRAEAAAKGDADGNTVIAAMVSEQRGASSFLRAHYSQAADRFAKAAELYSSLEGDHRTETAEALMNQAYALVQANDFKRVAGLYARASAITLGKYGNRHVKAAKAIHNQAFGNLSIGNPAAAAEQMEQALAIYRRVLEPGHPNLAAAEILMGRIYSQQGRHDLSLASLARARAIFSSLYGADNPAVADVDFYAAEAEAAAGRSQTALRLTDRVKRIYDAHYGPADPDQAELLLLRARIWQGSGDVRRARMECRRALDLQKAISSGPSTTNSTASYCATLS